jgi:hypothetical protein
LLPRHVVGAVALLLFGCYWLMGAILMTFLLVQEGPIVGPDTADEKRYPIIEDSVHLIGLNLGLYLVAIICYAGALLVLRNRGPK